MAISLVLGASPKAGAGAGAGAAAVAIVARVFLGSFRLGFSGRWVCSKEGAEVGGVYSFVTTSDTSSTKYRQSITRGVSKRLVSRARVLRVGSGLVEERICS